MSNRNQTSTEVQTPAGRAAPWLLSLAGRITIVTTAVAVLAVLVTASIAFPLIRSAAVDQAKQQLTRQADAFAAAPVASQALDLRERHLLGPDSYELSAITSVGTINGPASELLDATDIRPVLTGQKVSRMVSKGGVQFLVEARPLSRGGGIVLSRSLDEINAASAQLLQRTLLALAAGVVIAVLAGTLLARRIANPLAKTAAAARRIAAGQRTVPLDPDGVTEVHDVGEAINTLDRALLASEARQREFLLSISHEIRTPLTALRGYAEALEDGLIKPEEISGIGRTLTTETDRLDRFVRDLLALARLEADDFTMDVHPVDIGALLHQVQRTWQAAAAQSGVEIAVELPEKDAAGPLVATADPERLRQIIDGLLGNALRVSPPGGPISLRARIEPTSPAGTTPLPFKGPGTIAIEVQDSGPGLTTDDAAVAFERGILSSRYRGQRPTGSGLGLSIAARLAERMGLRLNVEPTIPGSGACFCIRIPLAPGTGQGSTGARA